MDDWSNWGVENPQGGTPQGGAQPQGVQPQGGAAPAQPETQVFGTASQTSATEGTIIEGGQLLPGQGVMTMAPRSRRSRWIAALGVVACLVLVTSLAAFVAISRSSSANSQTVAFAPKSSQAFATIRLDLPGAQHDKVAAFLSHFPGGRDTSSFDAKYDQILDKIVGGSTHNMNWSTDLKPWVQGEVSMAATTLVTSYSGAVAMPTMAPDGSYPAPVFDYDPQQVVFIVMVKDQAKAQAWLSKEEVSSRGAWKDETYGSAKLRVGGDTSKSTRTMAYTFVDNALLIGSLNAVKEAVDAKTKGSSLAQNSVYQAAIGHLKGDNLGWYWLDMGAYIEATLKQSGGGMTTTSCVDPQKLPSSWVIGSFRADDASLTVEMSAGPANASSSFDWSSASHQSQLVAHMPKNTMAAVEIHSLGKALDAQIAAFDDPKLPASCRQQAASIKAALDVVGGTAWIGDAAAVVLEPATLTGPNMPDAGLIVNATSEAAADKAMLAWPNALAAGGIAATKKTVDYKGTTITQVQPADVMQSGALQPAWARRGTLVVVGSTIEFVKAVLDATPNDSLASQQRYQQVMGIAGPQGYMFEYLDMAAYARLMAQQYTAMGPTGGTATSYQCDTKPYIDPMQAVGISATVSGGAQFTRIVITVAGKPAPLPSYCTKQ